MGSIAFYAPMKSPNHPVPSGDREMGRALMVALQDGPQDHDVTLVSELRCYDGKGDAAHQDQLLSAAQDEAQRLIAQGGWSAWVTYHNYYKAPDLIGPVVCQALNIPYFQIESTRASKRLGGPWDRFEQAASAACDAAAAVFYLTEQDGEALIARRPAHQQLARLQPFLPRSDLPPRTQPTRFTILSVGMMRPGAKLSSYQIIAQTLSHLDADWQLEIAGDGPARPEIEVLFAPFGNRVTLLGQLDTTEMTQAYGRASALLWPGVNEAFGMTYLEAQAAAVPVVAQDRPGVRDVLPMDALVPVNDLPGLRRALTELRTDTSLWTTRSLQARTLIRDHHLLDSARARLWSVITPYLTVAS